VRSVILVLALLTTSAAASPRKPSAPVKLAIESKPIPGGYEVTAVATPTRDVPELEVMIAGRRVSFGAVAANDRRELTMRVTVADGEGLDVVASATAGGRNKAAILRVGTANQRAAKRVTTHTLPNGRRVREAR
jgi:hypothetical protein